MSANSRKEKRKGKKKSLVTGRMLLRTGVSVLLIMLVAGACLAGWQWLRSSEIFRISSVDVSGCRHLNKEQVLALADLSSKESLLLLDIDKIRKRVEKAPWIKDVDVIRRFPDHLVLQVKEREPVAFVNREKFYLSDAAGVIFKEYSSEEKFSFPIITGVKMVRNDDRNIWEAESGSIKGFKTALEIIRMSSKGIRTLGVNNISQIEVKGDGSGVLYTADRAVPFYFGQLDSEKLSVQFARAEKILYHLYSSGRYSMVDRVDVNFMNNMALAHLKGT